MEGNSSNPTSSTPVPSIDQPIYTPPNQSQPLKKASKFSIKAIIGTIIFLLLAGGAAAGFVYREPVFKLILMPKDTSKVLKPSPPIPSEKLGWKSLVLDETNISFLYPERWSISEVSKSESDNFSVVINGLESETQIVWGGKGFGGGCSPTDKQDFYILGGTYELCHSVNEKDEVLSVLVHTKTEIPISIVSTLKLNSNELDTVKNILDSFKFIEEIPNKDYEWITYTNAIQNFSIDYPSSFEVTEFATNSAGLLVAFSEQDIPESADNRRFIKIQILEDSKSIDLALNNNPQLKNARKIIIGKTEFVETRNFDSFLELTYLTKLKDKTLLITIQQPYESRYLLEKMLSTFKQIKIN